MTTTIVSSPYEVFQDTSGQPLESGYIYVGTANLDAEANPVQVYFDRSLTIPAAQPIRTLGGFPVNSGTAAKIYVSGDYSIKVRDKTQSLVFSSLTSSPSPIYDTPADLEASIEGSRGVGSLWQTKDGHSYLEVTTGENLTNAVGVKLKLQPTVEGHMVLAGLNPALDGTTDDSTKLRAACASAYVAGRIVIINGTCYAPNFLHSEYVNVRFIGQGTLTGVYRRYVVDPFKASLPFVAPENFDNLAGAMNSTTTPTVVLVGDSIATYYANSEVRGGMLSTCIENIFRRAWPSCTFYNRAIGGTTFNGLDTVPAPTAWPEWYTVTTDPWMDYVEALTPDVVVLAFGMNDGGASMQTGNIRSIVTKLQAFAKVPTIIFATNLVPSLDGDSGVAGSTASSKQEDRDISAGWVRNYAQFYGFGLWDFHRRMVMVRDGFDPVHGEIGRKETGIAISTYETLDGIVGTEQVYNCEMMIPIDETAFAGADYINVHFGGSGANRVQITNNGGFYKFDVYNGLQDSVVQSSTTTTAAVGTDTSRDLYFSKWGNQISFYFNEVNTGANTPAIFTSQIIAGGGLWYPRALGAASNTHIVAGGTVWYDRPTRYMPLASDIDLWGVGSGTSIGTYGGSGWNHPSNQMAGMVYMPVLEQTQLLKQTSNLRPFTVEVADAATAGNVATGTFLAYYMKTGDRIDVFIDLTDINTSGMTGANAVFIRGLPFTVKSGMFFAMPVVASNVTPTTLVAVTQPATTYLKLKESGDRSTDLIVSDLTTTTADLGITGSYLKA